MTLLPPLLRRPMKTKKRQPEKQMQTQKRRPRTPSSARRTACSTGPASTPTSTACWAGSRASRPSTCGARGPSSSSWASARPRGCTRSSGRSREVLGEYLFLLPPFLSHYTCISTSFTSIPPPPFFLNSNPLSHPPTYSYLRSTT